MILELNIEMSARNGAQGLLRVITMVLGSGEEMSLTCSRVKVQSPSPFWVLARLSEYLMSSTVIGVPSENLTPWRMWKVKVVPSVEVSHFSARLGARSRPLLATRI